MIAVLVNLALLALVGPAYYMGVYVLAYYTACRCEPCQYGYVWLCHNRPDDNDT